MGTAGRNQIHPPGFYQRSVSLHFQSALSIISVIDFYFFDFAKVTGTSQTNVSLSAGIGPRSQFSSEHPP